MALEGVYLLLTKKVLSWDDIKKKMNDGTFVEKLKKINLSKINKKVLNQFKKEYIQTELWDLKKLKRASKAMGPLGEYLESIEYYINKRDEIGPAID